MTTEFLPVDPGLLEPFFTFSGGGGPLPSGGMDVFLMSLSRSSMDGGGRIWTAVATGGGAACFMADFLGAAGMPIWMGLESGTLGISVGGCWGGGPGGIAPCMKLMRPDRGLLGEAWDVG